MPKLVVNPNSPGRLEVSLSPGSVLTIGRDPTNDVVLPDAMVSRRHAVLEPRAGGFTLVDCCSANGSIVNGERVSERSLRDGDVVAIGTARLLFRADPPDWGGGKVVPHPSAAPLRCFRCGAEYRRGDVFCRECGTQVAQPSGPPKVVCSSCGSAVPLPARFCATCGELLASSAVPAEASPLLEPPPVSWSNGSMAIAAQRQTRDLRPEPVPYQDPPRPASRGHVRAEPAEPGSRIAAALVDAVFILSGQALILAPVAWYWWVREVPRTAADVRFLPVLGSVLLALLALLLGALYHVYFWSTRGATPGKELLDLQVVGEDGGRIGVGRAALRVFGYLLGVASLGIGFLMVVFGGRGLHDRIAATRVLRVNRP